MTSPPLIDDARLAWLIDDFAASFSLYDASSNERDEESADLYRDVVAALRELSHRRAGEKKLHKAAVAVLLDGPEAGERVISITIPTRLWNALKDAVWPDSAIASEAGGGK